MSRQVTVPVRPPLFPQAVQDAPERSPAMYVKIKHENKDDGLFATHNQAIDYAYWIVRDNVQGSL